MRTKNLNLKKKIAFIASVAMIASTAAYLPAEVTKDIFTGGITADAVVSDVTYETNSATSTYDRATAGTLDTLNAYIKIDGKYVAWNATENKYTLISSINDSDTNNKALLAFREAGTLVQAAKNTKSPLDDITVSTDAAASDDPAAGANRAAGDYVLKNAEDANAIELPYFADAKVVTLEFAPLKGSKISNKSITSIDIALDEHGIGRLGKQHDYVVGMSDTSTFDESKGAFKDTDGNGAQDPAGEYEVIDLSNLVVAMTGETSQDADGAVAVSPSAKPKIKLESINNGTILLGGGVNDDGNTGGAGQSTATNFGSELTTVTSDKTAAAKGQLIYKANADLKKIIDEEDLVPEDYPLMRVNGHFARVIMIQAPAALAPGESIEINTGKTAAWDQAGSNNSKVTVTMGNQEKYPEYAISNLVTHTSGTKKEYFVYVVKNAPRAGMSNVAATALSKDITWTDATLTAGGAIKLLDSVTANDTKAAGQGADAATGLVDETTRYKVKKEVVKKTVNTTTGNRQVYVTQYTIYNNETRDEWKLKGDDKNFKITFAGVTSLGSYGKADANVATAGWDKKSAAGVAYNGSVISILDKTTEYQKATGVQATPYAKIDIADARTDVARLKNDKTTVTPDGVITIEQSGYGCAESEVLEITNDANTAGNKTDYVQFVFTNEYKIKVNHDWADNKTDLTKKNYDEKVEVTGQKVTKPDKINRKGFEFDGWVADVGATANKADDTDKDIFRSDDWNTQYNDDTNVVTPNVKLVAKYTGKRYDIVLDANGGCIDIPGQTKSNSAPNQVTVNGSKTGPKYIHGVYNKQMNNDSFFSVVRNSDNDDFGFRTSATAKRAGYKFLGWSTDKDDTKKMSVRELEDAFPGEDKTLTLYAVYEAENNIPVNFKQVLFDENGVTLDTDGKSIKYDGGRNDVEFSSSEKIEFSRTVKNAIKTSKYVENAHFTNTPSVHVTAGQPIGELPVPYEKGYDFEGWYAKTWNDTLTNVEYVKVDKDTIVDEKLFADQEKVSSSNNAMANATVAYAKDDTANFANPLTVTLYAKFAQKTYNVTFDIGEGVWETSKIAKPDGKLPATMTYNGFRDAKKDEEKLGFRRPDGEVISVDEWRNIDNPKWGSGEINEFSNWTINGKGNYDSLDSVATALTKLGTLQDVVIKAVYEDTETSKSKIFLNANDGDFYQYSQAEKNPTTKAIRSYKIVKDDHVAAGVVGKSIIAQYDNDGNLEGYFVDADGNGKLTVAEVPNANNGVINYLTGELNDGQGTIDENKKISLEDFQMAGVDLSGGSAGIKVSSKWNIDGRNIEQTASGEGALGYTVARAGYDFTGWYTDKECTKKYTFSNYPAKGTEVILYAGWKKNSSSRYWLGFDVFSGDGSEVILKRYSDIEQVDGLVKYRKTYMGAIDDIAYARNLKIQIQDGEGTQATFKTYVFDPELSKNLNDTSKKIDCEYSVEGLTTGLFQQAQPYTTVYGRFVEEGFQSEEELQAPTNVRVVNGVVTWVGDETAVKYQIKKIVNGKASYSAYTTETSATIKNVPDEDYQVAVIAVDKNGNKKASSPVDVIVASSETFEAAKNVKVSDTGLVTWDAAKGAVKYQVLKVVGDTKAYTAKTTDTQIQLKSTSKDYQVIVIAFNADGKSKRSEAVSAKAFSNGLGIVTDAKYAADTKTVTWTAVDNAVKYQVLKVVNGKKFYGPYVTGTSYTFKKVPDGAFAYYVIAKDAAGNSTRGTMNKVTNHPSVTDVKLADDNKTVTFKAVEGATGYQLCKIVPGKNPAYSAISTNTTITFKNACTSGTQVYVLAFFDEAHKDASYSETIIVK